MKDNQKKYFNELIRFLKNSKALDNEVSTYVFSDTTIIDQFKDMVENRDKNRLITFFEYVFLEHASYVKIAKSFTNEILTNKTMFTDILDIVD